MVAMMKTRKHSTTLSPPYFQQQSICLRTLFAVLFFFDVASVFNTYAADTKPIQLFAGGDQTCATYTEGHLKCWGKLSNYNSYASPQLVKEVQNVADLSIGPTHSCAVVEKGMALTCWGKNFARQLGGYTKPYSGDSVTLRMESPAVSVAAGGGHTCVLLKNGQIQCFGSNFSGQLGTGNTAFSVTPSFVKGIATAVQMGAGVDHTCARMTDGTVWCWGGNDFGQSGQPPSHSILTPTPVSGIADATDLAVGNDHTCVLTKMDKVTCWGDNSRGELGQPDIASTSTPADVSGIDNAKAIVMGLRHTCVLQSDGHIRCWGDNQFGQLGKEVGEVSFVPVEVAQISNAVALAAGNHHTCALLADMTIRCWGQNRDGQLGIGTSGGGTDIKVNTEVPISAIGISNAVAITAGHAHTCVLLMDGTVQCWGDNSYGGQIGQGITGPEKVFSSPVPVEKVINAMGILSGNAHTCVILKSRSVQCWGFNKMGQAGNGSLAETAAPLTVSSLSKVKDVSAGGMHTCALLASGKVWCWGWNFDGELGRGTDYLSLPLSSDIYKNAYPLPAEVVGLSNIVEIAAGGSHTCARRSDKTIYCWGSNQYGQIGIVSRVRGNVTRPAQVPGIKNARSIAAGAYHTCALLDDGHVACWGGVDGPYTVKPVLIPNIVNAVEIMAGNKTTCVQLAGKKGEVICWKKDWKKGKGWETPLPVTLKELPAADIPLSAAIAFGSEHACILSLDKEVKCWGSNQYGQLGAGEISYTFTPMKVIE